MSFLLDVILIAICAVVIIMSAKRGFFRSLMGLVSKIVALIVAYTFTPSLSGFIKERFIMGPVSGNIANTLKNYVKTAEGYDFSKLDDMPPAVSDLLDRYGVKPETVHEKIASLESNGDEALESVSRTIADPVVSIISGAAAFILLFIFTCLILWIGTIIIDSVFKLPVLRTANTVLGVVFGVCAAVLVMFVYSSAVSSLVKSLGSFSDKWFGAGVVDRTILVKLFSRHDLLGIVKNVIS